MASTSEPRAGGPGTRPRLPAHPGLPSTPADDRPPDELGEAGDVAPFAAWLLTQRLDEPTRRRHRDVVEQFLRWARTDHGPAAGRRRRYEDHLARNAPAQLPATRAGLDRFGEHQTLLDRTLPLDHQPSGRTGRTSRP